MKVCALLADDENYMNLKPVSDSDWRILDSFNRGQSLSGIWSPIAVEEDLYDLKEPLPRSDFPSLAAFVPVFSQRAVDLLEDYLAPNGELLPLSFPGGQYYAYNCTNTVDCLDFDRSAIVRFPSSGRIQRIQRYFFVPDKLAQTEIFRIPEGSSYVFVTDTFARRIFEHGLTGFRLPVVWESQLG